MGFVNGIVTKPVTTDDLQQALSTTYTSNDKFCTHKNIRVWSKYKPVSNTSTFYSHQLAADGTWRADADWWKGKNMDCGITPPVGTRNLASAVALFDGNTNGWSYSRPTGTESSPYRLSDFIGYDSNAESPVDWSTGGAVSVYTNQDMQCTIKPGVSTETRLSLYDVLLSGSNDYYVGVIVEKGSSRWLITSQSPIDISGVNDTVTITKTNISTIGAGTIKVYPVITTAKATFATSTTGFVYPVPNVEAKSITIKTASDMFYVSAKFTKTIRYQCEVSIKNNTTSAVSARSINVYVMRGDTTVNNGTAVLATNVDISAGQSLSYNYTFNNLVLESGVEYIIRVSVRYGASSSYDFEIEYKE